MDIQTGKPADVESQVRSDGGDRDGLRKGMSSTYAEKTADEVQTRRDPGSKPVFMRQSDIPNAERNQPTGEEIYLTLSKVTSPDTIIGIQKVGGLWRLYIKDRESRLPLLSQGLRLRGVNVPIFDTNPFLRDNSENLLRVTIKDVPLSVSDEVISQELERRKCKLRGNIVRQRLRVNGQLTACLNGDRVLYVDKLEKPLDRHVRLSSFKARIFHDGQTSGAAFATCSRCLETGHHASLCVKPFVCKRCKGTGHKSFECEASRDQSPSVGATGEDVPKNVERLSGTESSVYTSRTTKDVNITKEKNVNNTSSLVQKDVNSRPVRDERSKQRSLPDLWQKSAPVSASQSSDPENSDNTDGYESTDYPSEKTMSDREKKRKDRRERKRRRKGSNKK